MDKVEVVARASGLHDRQAIARLKERILGGIRAAAAFTVQEVSEPSGKGLPCILVLTGGVEREVMKVVSELPSPTLLIAHDGHNSLPAALEILARIRQDGGEGEILFGAPEAVAEGLRRELQIAGAWEALRFSRVGLIGEPSEWLVASDVDRSFLKGQLGIDLVEVPIDELVEAVKVADPPRKDASRFAKEAERSGEADKEELRGAVALYVALKSLIDTYRLSACSVRCFDLISRVENTGCYALSRLNDEGIPAGCEGDLQALFTLFLGIALSGSPAFMGNVASVEPEARVIGLAHCTCPLSLATSYAIRSHFESGLGIGIGAQIPAGPCTVFRLGGERLDQLFVREGCIAPSAVREDLCRTQVRIEVGEPIDSLLTAPLGNHHVLVPGEYRAAIERFFNRHLRP